MAKFYRHSDRSLLITQEQQNHPSMQIEATAGSSPSQAAVKQSKRRRPRRHFAFSIALGLALSGPASLSKGQLLGNGGFEDTPANINLYGGSMLGPWQVLGSSGVSTISTTYAEKGNGMKAFNAENGLVSLDLTGINDSHHPTKLTSGITQNIVTTKGQQYALTFWVGRALGTASFYKAPVTVDLSVDGATPVAFTNSLGGVPGYVAWEQFTYQFTASGSSTSITAMNGSPDVQFAGYDAANVTPVPEPSTYLLVLAGAGGYSLMKVRRR